MLKLTTGKHEASCGFSATAELIVFNQDVRYSLQSATGVAGILTL